MILASSLGMNRRPIRWKLLIVLLALPFLGLAAFRFTSWHEAGWGGAASILAVVLALLLALVWLLGLSRLSWKQRLVGLALLGTIGAAVAGSVRVDGHMGDFFPQLGWKWTPPSDALADRLEIVGTQEAVPVEGRAAHDFPRFLGPDGSNWIAGSALPDGWASQTPKELWRRNIGLGWSSFSVVGPYAYTMEQRGERELTVCYEARTGEPIWVHEEAGRFSESMGGDGPRSTPTIHDSKVYALGAKGLLLCLDAASGEVVWKRETLEDGGVPMWAKSCSPLIVDDLVVVSLGNGDASLAAYDRLSGEPRWQGGEDSTGYASPILATLAGVRQIVSFNSRSLSGHRIETGEVLWSQAVAKAPAHNATPLLVGEDRVMIGIGYGRGSRLYQVSEAADGFAVEELWHSTRLKPKFADMIAYQNHAYGLDEGKLVCISLEDGKRAWRGSRFKHGQVLGVGDKIVVQAESGEIVIVEATPEEERIVHRFEALSGKTWNHPVIAGRLLLVRNDREAIVYAYE